MQRVRYSDKINRQTERQRTPPTLKLIFVTPLCAGWEITQCQCGAALRRSTVSDIQRAAGYEIQSIMRTRHGNISYHSPVNVSPSEIRQHDRARTCTSVYRDA